jgi:putative ABC transport system permease protein
MIFDKELWSEIIQSISNNKLRSILSGFTITFAILIFTLLFGIANGLQNTFESFFVNDASNSIFIRTGKTSKPYKGQQTGRRVKLSNKEYHFLNEENGDKIEYSTARIYKNFDVSYKGQKDNYSIRAVHPEHQFVEKSLITEGRYVNQADINHHLKIAVIGKLVQKDLFKGRYPIGKYINLQGISFKVVGIFEEETNDDENRIIYIPVSTAQNLYQKNDYINAINLTYNPKMNYDAALAFGNLITKQLKEQLEIAPKDQSAIRIQNYAEAKKNTDQMMLVLGLLILFIGSGTLIAGIVGISNIMVYIVKERTKELGIRKVLGASPRSIVGLILLEAITITSFAGYLGMLIGMGALNLIGDSFEKYFITDPSVESPIVITAVIVLIISGCIAGFLPAKKASEIKPIVALRAD